jgi:acyl-CoA synthetase (AMP-forming)/AMP-acid ligase II/acyl carrier protein
MSQEKYQVLNSVLKKEDIPSETYIEVFEKNCQRFPNKVLYYFLEDGYNETSRITYREMNTRARALAGYLQQHYRKGDRALLLFPPGIEFIASLFGCFYAGIIAVPAYPPRKNRMFDRFESILQDCSPSCILTTGKIHSDILKNFSEEECLKGIQYVEYEEVADTLAEDWKDPELTGEDITLLQYTSGSTGHPHGVMVSGRNLLHNSECIKRSFGHDENLQGVNWLPGFHDMGLIGALIQPAYVGGSNAIMPPNAFLMKPANWLRSISKFRCNTAGGPNFALDFCVDRIDPEEIKDADLSTVRPFFCGAEPIHPGSLDRFTEKFTTNNFTSSQFYPCYGLAESVLIVTGGALGDKPVYLTVDGRMLDERKVVEVPEDDPEAKTLVGCGYPWLGNKVVIADPHTGKKVSWGMVGEIWVNGPSVALGYWNKPGLTKETFQAYLAGTGEGPFLRTGDLGFIHEGQLYITGRIKDLIIIRGINHYPNDIERTVEGSHPSLQPAAGAAFSVEAGREERLVVVHEVRRTSMRDLVAEEVFEAIRHAVAENHQLQLHAIALIRPGSIPKTSSGKIQRFKAKKEFLENTLDPIASYLSKDTLSSPPYALSSLPYADDEVIEWIRNWMARELQIPADRIETDKPVASYGLDSLKAVLLAADASKRFGIDWPLELFLEETTIQQIVKKGRESM